METSMVFAFAGTENGDSHNTIYAEGNYKDGTILHVK